MTETTTNGPLMYVTSADSVKPTGAQTPADALGNPSMSIHEHDGNQSDDNVCPECGREFKNQHGMRIHYSSQHDGSLHTTQKCEWCGKDFRKLPGNERTFCSQECRGKRRSAEGLPARSRQVTLVCKGCGEEFSVAQSDAEAGKKYCSNQCYYNDSDAEWLNCEWCGDEFRAHGKHVDNARFCSSECYGTWIKEEQPKEEHSRYNNGNGVSDRLDYGPGWNEQKRERVRERDGHACVVCGMSQSEHLEECGLKLNVHHIIPVRDSDNPEVHNDKANLITLCAACHQRWEGIPLRPEVEQ